MQGYVNICFKGPMARSNRSLTPGGLGRQGLHRREVENDEQDSGKGKTKNPGVG